MTLVLDTNVISELMRPAIDKDFSNWILKAQNKVQLITSISIFEIEKGIHLLPEGKRKALLRDTFENVISKFETIPFDSPCAEDAAELFALRQSKGYNPKAEDMMIAGICKHCAATLATRNIKDFEGLPIEVINPWDNNL